MPVTTYAIGDVHGRLDLLENLLDMVEADAAAIGTRAKIVLTGDFVDRGENSFGVVERLMKGPRRSGDEFVCLRGNHDELFVRSVLVGEGLPHWAVTLFAFTIGSYGHSSETWRDSLEIRRHAEHLAELPLIHDDGANLFVHAGIRPGVAIEDQAEHDLLWIRDEFLNHLEPLPRRVVHGHTIMGDRPVVTANRISIDTGAYRSGILTAAVVSEPEVRFLQATGPVDRGAVIREELLSAAVNGRAVTPAIRRIYDAFLAGDIELIDLAERTRLAA